MVNVIPSLKYVPEWFPGECTIASVSTLYPACMASRRGERVNEADHRSAGGDSYRQGREWRAFLMNAIDRPFQEVKQDTVRKLFLRHHARIPSRLPERWPHFAAKD